MRRRRCLDVSVEAEERHKGGELGCVASVIVPLGHVCSQQASPAPCRSEGAARRCALDTGVTWSSPRAAGRG